MANQGLRTKLLTALCALVLAPAAQATYGFYDEGGFNAAADDPCVAFGSVTISVSDPTTGIADDETGKPRWKHTRTRTCANGQTFEEVEWLQYVSEWQPDPPGAPPPDPCVEAHYTDEGWDEGTC